MQWSTSQLCLVAALHIAVANRPSDRSITCLALEAPSLGSGDGQWTYASTNAHHEAQNDVFRHRTITSPSGRQHAAHHGSSPLQVLNYSAQQKTSQASLEEPADHIRLPRSSVSSNTDITHSNMGQVCSSLQGYAVTAFHRVIFLCAVIFIAVVFQRCQHLASDRLRERVNRTSKDVVGVNVQVGTVEMQVCRGRLSARDIVVDNPDGFHAEHLVRLDMVSMRLRICNLLWSWGRDVSVLHLAVSGVHVIYEKAFTTSNVDVALAVANTLFEDSPPGAEQGKRRRKPRSVTLHEVKIERVQVTFAVMGAGVALPVGDMRWLNFSREMGEVQPVMLLLTQISQAIVSKIGG